MSQERNEHDCYPIHMDFLPDNFREKAAKELKETPEKSKEELKKFKDLLSNDKITVGIDFEEDFLRLFLRYTKHNASKAFPYLRNFVDFRRNYSNLFISIPDEYFVTKVSTRAFSVLPYRSPDGCAIVVIELGKWEPDELSLEDFERMAIFTFFQTLRCPVTQINGFKVIYDFKDTSVKYLRYFTPQMLYLLYHVSLKCLPGRYKEVHCINGSIVMKTAWTVMKPFLSAKMRQRVIFHSESEDLLNHFPAYVVPSNYGGSLNDYHNGDLMRKLNREHGNFPIGGRPNYF